MQRFANDKQAYKLPVYIADINILAGLKQNNSEEVYAKRSFFSTVIDNSYKATVARTNAMFVTKTPAIKYDVSMDIILWSPFEKYESPEQ